MRLTQFRVGLALALLLGLAGVSASAQSGTGVIAGQVKDEQGAAMGDAAIVVRGQQPAQRWETQTDAEGRFQTSRIPAGHYNLLVLRAGEILLAAPVTLPSDRERVQLDIDFQKMRAAAEEQMTLPPELEQRRDVDRERVERESELRNHYNNGVRLLNEEKAEQAIKEFKVALTMEPDRGSTYALLGQAYALEGDRPAAYEAYQKALELEPGEAAHYNNLGALQAEDGRVDEAMENFRKAGRLDSERAATYQFNRGAALLNAGRAEEALPLLRQARETDPTLAVAHFFYGVALLKTAPPVAGEQPGQPSAPQAAPPGAIEAFQRYLQLEPDGAYADDARHYLEQLGAPATEMLLPAVPSPEDF